MKIKFKSSFSLLLCSLLVILSVGGCGGNDNPDPAASTPTTRTQRDNNPDPVASTPTTRTQRGTDSNLPLTEEEEKRKLKQRRIVVVFLILLILGGGGFLLFPLVSHLLESEDRRTKKQYKKQPPKATVSSTLYPPKSTSKPFPDKNITYTLDQRMDSLEDMVEKLKLEIKELKSQQLMNSRGVQRDENKTVIQHNPPVQAPPVDPLQVVIDAFNQQNADFFSQSYPLNPTPSTLQGQSSGTRRVVQFEQAGTHRDAAYMAVLQGQDWLIVPNFWFSYYSDPQYWLYNNEDIFAYSGSGYTVQLIKPAKAQFVQAQKIWKLAEAGSCILR